VNRVRYFQKYLSSFGFDFHLIYFGKEKNKNTSKKKSTAIHYEKNVLQQLGFYSYRSNKLTFFRVFYFFYFLLYKRDIYDFYRTYKQSEKSGKFNINKNDVVITTAPPYSVFNIGYYLKNKFGVKWILDYRDPWTLGYPPISSNRLANQLRMWFHRNLELKFLRSSDLIITVSESLKNSFPKAFHHKIHIVENGANTDEIDFSCIINRPDTFSIVYSGTIYDEQLEDTTFFKTLSNFIQKNKIIPPNFKLYFIGSADNEKLYDVINHFKLKDYVHITDRLELKVLYDYMYHASMFLHLKYRNHNQIITSKQYDYLALQKPVLLPVSDNGDIAKSIKEYSCGFSCHTEEEITAVLEKQWQKFLDGEDIRIYRDQEFIAKISRKHQVEQLAELLNRQLRDVVDNKNIISFSN
jgi:hypothetical protein